ncbi:MAG TPA: C25 family cysteine peptidase [Planctomycetota bacterium]
MARLLPTLLALTLGASVATAQEAPPLWLAVAPRQWTTALEPLREFRAGEMRAEVVALEDLLAATAEGADAAERLKRYLYGRWQHDGLRYLLLVGDVDVMPVRFMTLDRNTTAAFDYAFYASDLYYGDLAAADGGFEDWNGVRDGFHAGYFGEVRGEHFKDDPINYDAVHYLPEIAVGRWPVSQPAQVAALVAKTVAWERGLAGRTRDALVVHAGGWIDARPRAAGFAERLAAGGWTVARQFYDTGSAPTPAKVGAALRGSPALALHVGHGSNETWHECLGPQERDALAGTAPAVYFSAGCSTAHLCTEPPYQAYACTNGHDHPGTVAGEVFVAPPCPPANLQPGAYNSTGLGERLLRMPDGGAVVYLGCVTGSQPAGLSLLEGFAFAVGDGAATVGDAWTAGLGHYHQVENLDGLIATDSWYPPSIYFQGMKFVLMGDPALRLPSAPNKFQEPAAHGG